MNKWIAYCGLDCEHCDARIATVTQDEAMKKRVARLWSELNGAQITPDMSLCEGCRMDGRKTPYCASICPVRSCAMEREMETCGSCEDMEHCPKLQALLEHNEAARQNLLEQG